VPSKCKTPALDELIEPLVKTGIVAFTPKVNIDIPKKRNILLLDFKIFMIFRFKWLNKTV
jgi:hypothetical protein